MKVICETCGSDLNQHGQCPACLREDGEDANEGAHDDDEDPWDDSWDD